MADRRLVDSHPALVALQKRPGGGRVRSVLRDGEPWMTLVNRGEAARIVERLNGTGAAGGVFADLPAGGSRAIQFVPIDHALSSRGLLGGLRGAQLRRRVCRRGGEAARLPGPGCRPRVWASRACLVQVAGLSDGRRCSPGSFKRAAA